jgi:hypothetical protein
MQLNLFSEFVNIDEHFRTLCYVLIDEWRLVVNGHYHDQHVEQHIFRFVL